MKNIKNNIKKNINDAYGLTLKKRMFLAIAKPLQTIGKKLWYFGNRIVDYCIPQQKFYMDKNLSNYIENDINELNNMLKNEYGERHEL